MHIKLMDFAEISAVKTGAIDGDIYADGEVYADAAALRDWYAQQGMSEAAIAGRMRKRILHLHETPRP